jgi:hypothetical protein
MVKGVDRGQGSGGWPERDPPPAAKRARTGSSGASGSAGDAAGLPPPRPATARAGGSTESLAPRGVAPGGPPGRPAPASGASSSSGAGASSARKAPVPMTAETVCRLLEAHAKGVPVRVNAETLDVPRPTVNKWIAPGRWQSEDLARRLSKMPDYPAFRESLTAVATALQLHAGALPAPERPRVTMDAGLFKSALQALAAHKAASGGRGPALTQAALASTLHSHGAEISVWTLADWLSADGRPKRAATAVANLPGFEQERAAILQALSDLGHAESAVAIAQASPAALGDLRVGDLAAALTELARTPARGLPAICLERGMSVASSRYFTSDGRPRGNLQSLAVLPDFADHRADIVAALAALGHGAEAASLPVASMPLRDVHDQLGRDFHRVTRAITDLRAQPTTSLADAARAAGIAPQLLAVLVQPGGELHERAAIDARIVGQHALLGPALAGMLDRLEAALAPDGAPAPGAMKTIRIDGAGRAPDKILVVQRDSVDPGGAMSDRLRRIFLDNPGAVRAPRSFEGDRPRQALRWLATALKEQFPLSVEIQCYFHPGTRQLVLSSNVDEVNDQLRDFLREGGLEALVAGQAPAGATASADRAERHPAKLSNAMGDMRDRGEPELENILAAMAERRFQVPARRYTRPGKTFQLHAERRIKNFVEMLAPDFDPLRLAGTMRPCGNCADDVVLPAEATRGPFWDSANAQVGTHGESVIARAVSAGTGTSITETRGRRLTFETNTDSDSDG